MSTRSSAAAAAAIIVGVVLGACGSGPKPDSTVSAYLGAWSKGDLAGAAKLTDNPTAARAALEKVSKGLGGATVKLTKGRTTSEDETGTARFAAAWTIPGLAKLWTYNGQLALAKKQDKWLVHWEPRAVHPRLGAGDGLSVQRTLPARAPILDRTGRALFVQTAVVTVGIEPRRVTDLPALARTLAAVLNIDAATIVADVSKAQPSDFVEVITLRKSEYDKVRPRVYNLPGTVFRSGQQVLAPSPRFAQPLLGKVGDATAEVLKEAGPAYRPGDQLGLSGLQRAFNRQLAGSATGRVSAIDAEGTVGQTLGDIPGSAGKPVTTTIDQGSQIAADSALASVPLPAAIVALRPSTGEIVAVANSARAPFNIAMAGKYPPGSTFKIVTVTAALAGGVVQPTSVLGCPATVTIGGRTIPNSKGFALGNVPVRRAFARSCNTTMASLGLKIDPAEFQRTAALYGIGAGWQFPVASFSGSVQAPEDSVQRAFDAIGQGKVLVSPMAGALMAATVEHGTVPTPTLIAGHPAKAKVAPAGGLPAKVLAPLRDFTRAVVTEGTATELASVPGGPVAGKTGTAEFGTTSPPQAHSWFVGYRGDLAFAVFVYGGQTSGTLANPVAKAFLTRLAR